jgi:hypothetical protein
MTSTYIEDFYRNMEANANYLFEKGMMVSFIGWHQETCSYLRELNLEQIAQASPELAEVIIGNQDDEAIIEMLKQTYPALIDKRAKKALNDLRKKGVAKLPVSRKKIDAPRVTAVPSDGDVFFPPFTIDPQQSPHVFYRAFMTPQEIRQKVANDGWDEDWADYVIENYRGVSGYLINGQNSAGQSHSLYRRDSGESDFVEVLYVYQRLIDEEDGSEGIYLTVMHPEWTGDPVKEAFAIHELQNGLEDYPFVVTRISEQSRRLYDVETFADLLRGIQWQVKVERDSRIDKSSLSTLPALRGPNGRPPPDLGPGRYLGERRKGEYDFLPPPQYTPDSVQIETILIDQGDKLIGLDYESPNAMMRQQFYVDKFLTHVRDVLRQAYKHYQLYGPDELFFRVTGVSDPQKFTKGDPNENFDIIVSFDTQNNDPETQEKKLGQLVQLMAMDRNGKFNVDRFLEIAAGAVDPVLADAVLQPTEVAQEQVVKQVFEDLTMISSGIERPARPNGAQIALSVVQQWAAQPDIAQKLQGDEAFATRVQKYAEQYQFQLQQMQNAQTGRIGTTPAQVGNVQSQGIQ